MTRRQLVLSQCCGSSCAARIIWPVRSSYDVPRARDGLSAVLAAMARRQAPPTVVQLAPQHPVLDSIHELLAAIHRYRTLPPPSRPASVPALPIDNRGIDATVLLSSLLQRRVRAQLTDSCVAQLRVMLRSDHPNMLELVGKAHDENAHSSVIAWLLNPRCAPTVAPAALHKLAARLYEPSLLPMVKRAIDSGVISVRREFPIPAQRSAEQSGRLDIVVFGEGFTIGIENKTQSSEHSSQTVTYWNWLRLQPGAPAGVLLSPAGEGAVCSDFQSLSYLELLPFLLEAPASAQVMTAPERAVLSGYCKALASFVLRHEISTALQGE